MQQNWIQVLDADKLVPVLDAASISASKVFQVPAIIVIQQKWGEVFRIGIVDRPRVEP